MTCQLSVLSHYCVLHHSHITVSCDHRHSAELCITVSMLSAATAITLLNSVSLSLLSVATGITVLNSMSMSQYCHRYHNAELCITVTTISCHRHYSAELYINVTVLPPLSQCWTLYRCHCCAVAYLSELLYPDIPLSKSVVCSHRLWNGFREASY